MNSEIIFIQNNELVVFMIFHGGNVASSGIRTYGLLNYIISHTSEFPWLVAAASGRPPSRFRIVTSSRVVASYGMTYKHLPRYPSIFRKRCCSCLFVGRPKLVWKGCRQVRQLGQAPDINRVWLIFHSTPTFTLGRCKETNCCKDHCQGA